MTRLKHLQQVVNLPFYIDFSLVRNLRWMRYLVLILVLGTISFNQVFIIFLDYKDILGGWIYTFTFLIPAHLCSELST